ncbi:hypothetical protein ACQPZQ_02935 [Pseudonocardia sp. CA-142604]|uniref:hypothetical protein n=1 Tax=Pseudonocardia sp. CA-142604 TaxID=3240024 RepID=UPI003D8D2943
MNTKKLAGAGAAAFTAATAVTALLLGSTAAVAQEAASDSAYALSASGLLNIDPISYVESTDGNAAENQLAGIGDVLGENQSAIGVGVLTAEARGGASETSVTKLNLLQLLRADLVRTYCEDGDGGMEIVRGTLLGRDLPETPVPSQVLDVSPLVKLTLNDQVRHEDGSLTVTGIELTVLPGAGENLDRVLTDDERAALPELTGLLGTELPTVNTVGDLVNGVTEGLGVQVDPSRPVQTITVGSATCSAGDGDGDADGAGNGDDDGAGNGDDNGDDNGDADDATEVAAVGVAPAPQVMDASLPVTG